MSNQKLPPQGRRISFQDFGYFAKNQFSHTPLSWALLKISKLASLKQWIFSTLHSLIFLTTHTPQCGLCLQGRRLTPEKYIYNLLN
ncbi:hypothetical protein [Capnocytophaga sp.]|uniref:hypothetical protein n=1 Tax=Capnocytophaga sp. TaxID=44737 RepID=UPI0026DAB0BC|nr:hypothetical protein [Capnocytophaga sp.]MDO5106258.1 hypothetical protein [Capnocytophaga sp.]